MTITKTQHANNVRALGGNGDKFYVAGVTGVPGVEDGFWITNSYFAVPLRRLPILGVDGPGVYYIGPRAVINKTDETPPNVSAVFPVAPFCDVHPYNPGGKLAGLKLADMSKDGDSTALLWEHTASGELFGLNPGYLSVCDVPAAETVQPDMTGKSKRNGALLPVSFRVDGKTVALLMPMRLGK